MAGLQEENVYELKNNFPVLSSQFIHPYIHTVVSLFIHTVFNSFNHTSIQWWVYSSIQCLIHSSIHAVVTSFIHTSSGEFIHPYNDMVHNLFIHFLFILFIVRPYCCKFLIYILIVRHNYDIAPQFLIYYSSDITTILLQNS